MTWTGDPADLFDAVVDVAELVHRPRTPFAASAACRDHPELSWFPAKGEHSAPAKAVCEGCPVVADCLAFALADDTLTGVWGATSTACHLANRPGLGLVLGGRDDGLGLLVGARPHADGPTNDVARLGPIRMFRQLSGTFCEVSWA